ncbi:MAG: phospho-N-acetylmuramoyl-pentapeptide-transferase [Ruminococcaceae bacterium]|nr:phospho-N-acetylmuramoyl-pentapeptide-transferase [Oscillospiraceae bacterium]
MFKELLVNFATVAIVTFVLTVIISKIVIPILRGHKIGQSIREEGPHWHRSKAGTPTMGGICFIMAMLISLAIMTVIYFTQGRQEELIPLALTLGLALANGLIGFVDDYCKLIKKQNEGLKVYQKTILHILVAAIYVFVMELLGCIDTSLSIPFTDISIELGWLYYVFAIGLIFGMATGVNFTDGIDGLASSVTLVISVFFGVVALTMLSPSLTLISAALIGGLCGFLVFNIHPAKVFMGDTGSLFLGGAVTGAAFIMGEPLVIVIIGGIYIIEVLSVIIQVTSFKLRAKRVFKMTPIHHHFEKCGWGEGKIVMIFSAITVALCVIGWFSI